MTTLTMIAALLGMIAREAISIIPAIKEDDNSPNRFSFRYYFSRPKNQLIMLLNVCGSGMLFLAQSEVAGMASVVPYIGDHFGHGTPVLLSGAIGFTGASVLRWYSNFLTKKESE